MIPGNAAYAVIPQHFEWSANTMYIFEDSSFAEIEDLVEEAEAAQAFVPMKGDVPPYLLNLFEYFQQKCEYRFFLLLDNQRTKLGFLLFLLHPEENAMSIGSMYIGQKYQGQGLGIRLVKEAVQWAKAQGADTIFTQTWGQNIRSQRIFERFHFQRTQEIPDTRINGDSTVKYEHSLAHRC
jgi:RimJ/RimL family protein N-acetyltransferase